ncbi:MAG: hypothetical protein NT135_01165 [Candidatus Berkelbacteria bacterium]|nr:hypothetical protein [Candidatus Berkelbacteria bacterium]
MFIRNFAKLSKTDTKIAGGKGASLGEMTRAGFSVPPGFVVLSSAFDKFLDEAQIGPDIETILSKVDHEDINSADGASAEITTMIKNAKFPEDIGEKVLKEFKKLGAELVAVRSSATAEDSLIASWAGELETYLNMTEKNLLESVKKCWSSLFTPRAIFYRFEKGLYTKKVSVAVVIQKMIQSEVSGITFTVHPVTKDHSQMVIEAGFGLGEAIVGGKITPDTYIVDKEKNEIIEKYISEQKMMIVRSEMGVHEVDVSQQARDKQKLTDKKILELAEICHKIEQHYHYPQDIEWALEKNKFYITQSRPITTL